MFGEWADDHAIDCVSEEAIRAYSLEKIGCWEAAINLPSKDRITLRALRMLNDFFKGEPFEGRTPLKEHRFYTILKDHVHPYLRWCEEDNGYRPSTIQYKFWILCRYENFLHDKILDIKDVTIGLNEEFFASDACGNRTSYKSSVREMLQYLCGFSILGKDLSPYVLKESKRSKHLEIPTTYTSEELKSLLGNCNAFNSRYFFQTKNPERFKEFTLPDKSVVCTTIETNSVYPEIMINSPIPSFRVTSMSQIDLPKYVTIEPIMDFDLEEMVDLIRRCNPVQVNIGADSGGNNFPEPDSKKVTDLIAELKQFTVIEKKTNLGRIMRN